MRWRQPSVGFYVISVLKQDTGKICKFHWRRANGQCHGMERHFWAPFLATTHPSLPWAPTLPHGSVISHDWSLLPRGNDCGEASLIISLLFSTKTLGAS